MQPRLGLVFFANRAWGTEGFSNDFAQWVLTSTNRGELAETLASVDIRDYVSISELRADLHRMVADYCLAYPEIAAKLGENGHRHVKEKFLITSNLRRYFKLFLMLSKCPGQTASA